MTHVHTAGTLMALADEYAHSKTQGTRAALRDALLTLAAAKAHPEAAQAEPAPSPDSTQVLPRSYRSSTLVTDSAGFAKVSFHFGDAKEADAWHEAALGLQSAPVGVAQQ